MSKIFKPGQRIICVDDSNNNKLVRESDLPRLREGRTYVVVNVQTENATSEDVIFIQVKEERTNLRLFGLYSPERFIREDEPDTAIEEIKFTRALPPAAEALLRLAQWIQETREDGLFLRTTVRAMDTAEVFVKNVPAWYREDAFGDNARSVWIHLSQKLILTYAEGDLYLCVCDGSDMYRVLAEAAKRLAT